MTTFFTADLHLGHKMMAEKFRPQFGSIEVMDEVIINNWNDTIGKKDEVWLLGDVGFYKPKDLFNIVSQLNGRKYLIKGNHDKTATAPACRNVWERIEKLHEVRMHDLDFEAGHQKIVLCHYPMLTWNKSHYGTWHLHGHCHGNLSPELKGLRLDIGVDCHDYRPISYDEVKVLMQAKEFEAVDHHEK